MRESGSEPTVSRLLSSYLVRVSAEVKVLQEAGGKLTEQEVVSVVDGPQAPVGVVVGAGAGAEGAHWNGTRLRSDAANTQNPSREACVIRVQ